jgi:hypothetical protein
MPFLRNLAKHPGTWTFLALSFIGIGIAVPPAAPGLVVAAAVLLLPIVVTSFHFFGTHKHRDENSPNPLERFLHFVQNHPVQAAIAFLAFGLFVTAFVLTIGFFTGGAGFAFMAPVFAAMAAPFATAAASAGIELAVSALAATTLVLASINIPNTLKRFSAWLDSFKYDAAATDDNEGKTRARWANARTTLVDSHIKTEAEQSTFPYIKTIFHGVVATVQNGFSSPDAEKLNPKVERVHN